MSGAAHTGTPAATHSLAQLTADFAAVPAEVMVSDVTLDSRAVLPGALFLACRGRRHHGLEFARDAVARGARAVLYERDGDTGEAAPQLPAGTFIAAVPCAWLLAQALQHCHRPAAYIGTLGVGLPAQLTPTLHTTSDAVSIHRQLAALRALGAECVSMEVSSHALDQGRVNGVRFNTAAFTNLTRDHLDYHGTMEAYGAAKERLFSWPGLAHRVINIDDPFGARLAAEGSTASLTLTTRAAAALPRGVQFVRAARITPEPGGLSIAVESSYGSAQLPVRLMGEFNADNALTVLAVLLAWNIPLAEAARALSLSRAARGRMEMFGGRGRTPLAIVDYAHTPDALANALRAARLHCRGQLRVVFGCGGDRDAGKRPLMGKIAAELADDIIVTDDNPRSEDPARIVADIVAGVDPRTPLVIEHDRSLAIRLALQRSGPEDVVLIAGKGHEDYQIHGSVRRAFRDQAVVSAELARLPA